MDPIRPADLGTTVQNLLDAFLGQTAGENRSDAESAQKFLEAQLAEYEKRLSDSERNGSFRFRMVMSHDQPDIPAYDQDLWAERLRYSALNVNDALEEFSALRRANVRLFERASEADLARIGMHSERGEESLGYMLKLYAGHDIVHLRQIERIRRAIGAQ